MMVRHRPSIFVVVAVLTALAGRDLAADDWPQWRGPNWSGAAEGSGYPVQWSAEENVAWKVALPGGSGSTPAVWGDRIFVTTPGDGVNLLLCYSLDGEELWRQALGDERAGKHQKGSGANPSPTTDGERVYAYYKSGDLAAVDFEGNVVWRTNLQERFGEDTLWWDLGSSPVLTRDFVVATVVQTGPSYLAAFDRATGELAWKHDRVTDAPLESAQTYATPVVVGPAGEETLVVLGADYMTAHTVQGGDELWRVGTLNPEHAQMWRSIASAVVFDDVAVAPYARGDSLTAVRLGGSGNVNDSHVIWRKGLGSDVPTPAAADGKLFVLGDRGTVTCLDVRTGEELWSGQFPRSRTAFSSSPVAADGHLYCIREDGVVFVTPTDRFEVVAENDLGEFSLATPIFLDGKVLIKTFEHLICLAQ